MQVIKLSEKFSLFNDQWTPKIVGELNGQHIKLAKVQGEFVWHNHQEEDELFFVVKGKLNIAFKDKTLTLNAGEMLIVPKGVEHKPFAEEEVLLMLFEPAQIKHTGAIKHELTKDNSEWI
ncbi:mannose-6-phosphate isomerase [Marivirga lumbricoides]|uniref:Mannose-6-phosphate isomerase n=1 Tax=Marivirga lumbricoides TaxID=1046115 RepID=A0ABQ1MF72_9BACT|nr:mannose-6-phosphate isomerase [Marivirga lumbricoides]